MGLHSSDNPSGRGRSASAHDASAQRTIGEFAREFDVSLRTLRFYEDRGLLEPQRDGTARLYSPRDKNRLRAILRLKHLGFTLTEIRDMLTESAGEGGDPVFRLRAGQVQAQIAHLERQRQEIDGAIAALRDVQQNESSI